tara:strand:+ start:170 stop:733 length:564 start_codon:yes stop_codon:yes gene_type:complete
MSQTEIIFIRHAEAAISWEKHSDPVLSDLGITQSKNLIHHNDLQKLNNYDFVSSPKLRAIQTSEYLTKKFNKELLIDNTFIEIPSDNIHLSKKKEWFNKLIKTKKDDLPDNIKKWRDDILTKTKSFSQNTIIFTHFMVMNLLVSEFKSKDTLMCFYPENTSILKIEIMNKEFKNFSTEKSKKTFINL